MHIGLGGCCRERNLGNSEALQLSKERSKWDHKALLLRAAFPEYSFTSLPTPLQPGLLCLSSPNNLQFLLALSTPPHVFILWLLARSASPLGVNCVRLTWWVYLLSIPPVVNKLLLTMWKWYFFDFLLIFLTEMEAGMSLPSELSCGLKSFCTGEADTQGHGWASWQEFRTSEAGRLSH